MVGKVARSDTHSERNVIDSLDIVLGAVPLSISTARHAVRCLLDSVAIPPEVREDILLLVSELVTNAVLHAGTAVHVAASVYPDRVIVAVSDDDPHHSPLRPDRGPMATSGRGMRLVELLASSWGVEVLSSSKVVWFEKAYQPVILDLRSSWA